MALRRIRPCPRSGPLSGSASAWVPRLADRTSVLLWTYLGPWFRQSQLWFLLSSRLSSGCTWKQDGVGPAPTNLLLYVPSSPLTLRRCAQMIPVRRGSICAGPRCWFKRPAVAVARPGGPASGPPKGGTLPPEPAKTGAPARIGVLQHVIFTTGFS